MSEEKWIFVVDTEQYAGNFERDMCAFMTGMTGDCGVGGEEAQLFLEQTGTTEDENTFEEFVTLQSDEHGCARPTAIWSTEGKSFAYNSVAIFFGKKPTEELVEIMIKRAKEYAEYARNAEEEWDRKDIKVVAFRLLKEETVQTLDARWIAEYT